MLTLWARHLVLVRGLSGEKFLKGETWKNCWTLIAALAAQGDGCGRGCVPEHGKLKYNTVSIILFSVSHLIDTSGFRTNTCSGSKEYN